MRALPHLRPLLGALAFMACGEGGRGAALPPSQEPDAAPARAEAESCDTLRARGIVFLLTPSGRFDFGELAVGQRGPATAFRVTNCADRLSPPITVALHGTSAAEFEFVDGDCAGPLRPAESCTLRYAFKPLSSGPKEAWVSVAGAGNGVVAAAATVGLVGAGR